MNLTQEILCSWPLNVRVHSYVLKSQSLMFMSDEQETMRAPVASNAMHWTGPVCPESVRSYWPVSKSQILIAVSSLPEATNE